mmetsp:Transcript_28007/g.58106  ORF Transcript_28007/g.58106 Transcript_28007/m.58106 type:complete len:80 (-) Transcript_28007:804-1043(-)
MAQQERTPSSTQPHALGSSDVQNPDLYSLTNNESLVQVHTPNVQLGYMNQARGCSTNVNKKPILLDGHNAAMDKLRVRH